MSKRSDWVIIGICGVTCGGKTTLSNNLKDIITPVYIFHQDQYFYPDDSPHHIKCENLDHNDYDILSALDMDGMYSDILKTIEGENKSQDSNVERRSGKLSIKDKKFLIVEGFTVLNFKPINDICDLRYYFVLEFGECAARRALRVYSPPDVPGYFESCVWPRHVHYRAQIEQDTRVTLLDGTRPDIMEQVIDNLKGLGAAVIE